MQKIDKRHTAKIPVQARSKLRFNKILETAERLMLEVGVDEVSPHKIAKEVGISATSVYQYFPTIGALYSTMAEIHFVKVFEIVDEKIDDTRIRHWQDLANIFVDGAYDFYSQDKISETLFLGMLIVPSIKELTASRLTRFSQWYAEKFSLLYKKKDLEPLAEKIAISIEIMKGIYIRNLSINGELSEYYREEARIIIVNYLRDFFNSIEK